MAHGPQAQLFPWGARALYLGPAFDLSPHRNAVAVLAVGVSAPFELADDPEQPATGYLTCRTALIPPNTVHHLRAAGTMAFLYLDAHSPDLERVRAGAFERTPRADLDLSNEDELIARFTDLASGAATWAETRSYLETWLRGARPAPDARVKRALALLHADPSTRPSLANLAAEAGLSTSRFIHLFKTATGVPLRRYKLWVGMGAAMRAIARGEPLTIAALDAGFSSSAHFSAAFREMFGMEPSRLAGGKLTAA